MKRLYYVDEIFELLTTQINLEESLIALNNIPESIQFILETETDYHIPFLMFLSTKTLIIFSALSTESPPSLTILHTSSQITKA